MVKIIYSAVRELDDLLRRVRREPDLVPDLLRLFKMRLDLHDRKASACVQINFGNGRICGDICEVAQPERRKIA